jgi:hypothetical protein
LDITLVVDPEAGVVEFNGMRYTPEEARDIGEKLLQGAAVVEAITPVTESMLQSPDGSRADTDKD